MSSSQKYRPESRAAKRSNCAIIKKSNQICLENRTIRNRLFYITYFDKWSQS